MSSPVSSKGVAVPDASIHIPQKSAISRLVQLQDVISSADIYSGLNYWRRLTQEFFAEDVVFKIILGEANTARAKKSDVPYNAVPRYFDSFFTSGAQRVRILFENPREFLTPSGSTFVECTRCSMTVWYEDKMQVVSSGSARLILNPSFKVEWMEQEFTEHNEMISTQILKSQMIPSLALDQRPKPEPKENGGLFDNSQSKKANMTAYGFGNGIINFLEISDVFSYMKDMIGFAAASSTGNSEAMSTFRMMTDPSRIQLKHSPEMQARLQQLQQQQLQQLQIQQQARQQQSSPMDSPVSAPVNPNRGNSPNFITQSNGNSANSNSRRGSLSSPRGASIKRRRASSKSEIGEMSPGIKRSPKLKKG